MEILEWIIFWVAMLAIILQQILSLSDNSVIDTDNGKEARPTDDISSNISAGKATHYQPLHTILSDISSNVSGEKATVADEILEKLSIFLKKIKIGFRIFIKTGPVWFFIFCIADVYIFTPLKSKINEFTDSETRFPQKGECLTSKNLTVIQAWPGFRALVAAEDFPQAMLLENNNKIAYYDRMLVKIPPKKCARQVGTYRYETKEKEMVTVPIIIIDAKGK